MAELERDKALNTLNADRSVFVEEMIIASLIEPLNIDTIFSTKPVIEVNTCPNNDENINQNVSETNKNTKDDHCETEIKENKSAENFLTGIKSTVDNIKKPDDNTLTNMKLPIKYCENNVITSFNYPEPETVQPKPLPLIATGQNPSFIMSQSQLNHRNRISKGRPTSNISPSGTLPPNLASLAIRSSLTPRAGTIVVSPTGRRKVLKHPTESPQN